MIAFWIALVVILLFGVGAALGAPWLPTHRRSCQAALALADLRAGQSLLDLGSGTGTLLVAAARQGIKSEGIEINPLLWFVAWLRLWPYRKLAKVRLGNYWQRDWPTVDCIYVFLIGRYMGKLAQELKRRIEQPTKVISYTFEIPEFDLVQAKNGLYLYSVEP